MHDNLSKRVYKRVINDIITGKIEQEEVITESMLIEKFGVSKSPVREALVRLCNDDVLYSIPRHGYRMKLVNNVYLEEIVEFRLMMEPYYLNKYFDRIKERDIIRINEKIVSMDKDEFSSPMEYWEKTSVFHLELAYSYRDSFFYDMLKKIMDMQLITFSKLYWDRWSDIIDTKLTDNHKDILAAIQNSNREEALRLLQKDIKSF